MPNVKNVIVYVRPTVSEGDGNTNIDFVFSFLSAVAYGNGVYFAASAKYYHGYTSPDASGHRHMYLSSVLTGEYTQGASGLKVPPPKHPSKPSILFDSVVDRPGSPGMFIIFSDTQAYPNYLITYC